MSDTATPLILYVPGLLPKPAARQHREALRRCLLEGVRRVDPALSDAIRRSDNSFDLVAWTYDFYREHRDIGQDEAAINAVIEQQAADDTDIREASSLMRRLTLFLYRMGDRLPFLIPHLANERMEVHLQDLRRYYQNEDGAADRARELLKQRLRAAHETGRPVLLLAHSMGSVIAFDSLWQLSHKDHGELHVDTWVTMGSPLGQNYLQKRILGHAQSGRLRYPTNVGRWINLAAVGDLTAIDPHLGNDFAEMVELGLVESIEDLSMFNYYRLDGQLNVHAEYGYLVNEVTGRIIADWWRKITCPAPDSA